MKQYLGIILIVLTYLAIASQAIAVYFTWDEDILTYILFHKLFFYLTAFLATISHIRASLTNPGRINHDNNISVLEFYVTTFKTSREKAEDLNNVYKNYFQVIKRTMAPEQDDSDISEIDSDDDNINYSRNSEITDVKLEEINKEWKTNFERCKKCYVVRIPNTHHCSKCRSCVMKMDHHCPWINNCVGFFNQKYFILFCYYCFIGCCHASYITTYYFIFLNKDVFLNSAVLISVYSIQIFTAVIFIIFNAFMLKDQFFTIKNDMTLIDYKQGKIEQSRSFEEVLYEVFGESFSPFWFLPVDRSNRRKIKRRKRN
jgi:hypothetical protein